MVMSLTSFSPNTQIKSAEINSNFSAVGNNLVPSGTLVMYAGSSAPSGWLLCYGQEISQSTYADLYAILGTTYNTGGEGAGNFRVPDLRGRVAAGKDNMGGSAASRLTASGSGITGTTLGAAGGAETHTLTTAQIPAHSHSVTDPGHYHGSTSGDAYSSGTPSISNADLAQNAQHDGSVSRITNSGTTGVSIANTGGGGVHNNTQPTIVVTFIIKT